MPRRLIIVLAAFATALVAVPASAAAPDFEEVVVVLQPTDRPVPQQAEALANAHSGDLGYIYTTALQGFTLTLPSSGVDALARNPNVAYVEPVQQVEAFGTQPIPTGIDRIDSDLNPPTVPMDVDIAILDTGVYIGTNSDGSARSHLDLNLRYVSDCTNAVFYPMFGGGCSGSGDFQDGHGHGTHVAGIAAALDNDIGSLGVAPGATLWSFKVLRNDGTGTTGMILAGIDAVASQAHLIEVANMSLGFEGTSQAIDDAIANAVDAGVVFVVAAGNSASDASTFSPASGPDVITVSAIADFDGLPHSLGSPTCRPDVDDTLADFSNFGPAVEIAAPGVCIFSTDLDDGYSIKSGTSMASPFVAGAVARYLAENNIDPQSRTDVMNIRSAIVGAGMPQTEPCGFTDVDSSPEPLLFLNGALFGGDGTCGTGTEPANSPPTADFTASCTDLSCTFTDQSSDADGNVESWSWDFGDGAASTDQSPIHTYTAGSAYTVSLTVTDNDGATDTTSSSVTVTEPPASTTIAVAVYPIIMDGRDAQLDAWVTDSDGNPIAGASVEGEWSYTDKNGRAKTNPDSGTTEPGGDVLTGNITFSKRFPPGTTVDSFCVTNVTSDGYTFGGGVTCGFVLTGLNAESRSTTVIRFQ